MTAHCGKWFLPFTDIIRPGLCNTAASLDIQRSTEKCLPISGSYLVKSIDDNIWLATSTILLLKSWRGLCTQQSVLPWLHIYFSPDRLRLWSLSMVGRSEAYMDLHVRAFPPIKQRAILKYSRNTHLNLSSPMCGEP